MEYLEGEEMPSQNREGRKRAKSLSRQYSENGTFVGKDDSRETMNKKGKGSMRRV